MKGKGELSELSVAGKQTKAAEDAELARVLEACLHDVEAGRAVDPDQVVAEHPRIAGRLRGCLASLQLVEQATVGLAAPADLEDEESPVPRLGDYRITRSSGEPVGEETPIPSIRAVPTAAAAASERGASTRTPRRRDARKRIRCSRGSSRSP